MTIADLLWESSTANWLVAGGWCWFSMREQNADWLADKPNEQSESIAGMEKGKPTEGLLWVVGEKWNTESIGMIGECQNIDMLKY